MFSTVFSPTDHTKCCFFSSYAYRDNEQITLKYFENFNELEFNCSPINITILEIKPKMPLILDNSLKKLSVTFKAPKLAVIVILKNLKGINRI